MNIKVNVFIQLVYVWVELFISSPSLFFCSGIHKCAATHIGAIDTHAPEERGSNVDSPAQSKLSASSASHYASKTKRFA